MNWFRRRGSNDSNATTNIPDLPTSVGYNGDHHISYSVARNRLKKAITEFYRSLELLKSYKVNHFLFYFLHFGFNKTSLDIKSKRVSKNLEKV